MKLTVCTLPVLLASLCIPVAAAQGGWMQMTDQRRNELRDAVEAHRSSQREEVRREETQAGRRLTAAELAELREQVRQQWAPRGDAVQSAESTGALRSGTSAVQRGVQVQQVQQLKVPAPRLQRP